jgi:hypothetical protein
MMKCGQKKQPSVNILEGWEQANANWVLHIKSKESVGSAAICQSTTQIKSKIFKKSTKYCLKANK